MVPIRHHLIHGMGRGRVQSTRKMNSSTRFACQSDNADKTIQSRHYHDDVSNMVLIYQELQSTWSRGHTLKQRRFSHCSILYAQALYHIGGGLNYKSHSIYLHDQHHAHQKRLSCYQNDHRPSTISPGWLQDDWYECVLHLRIGPRTGHYLTRYDTLGRALKRRILYRHGNLAICFTSLSTKPPTRIGSLLLDNETDDIDTTTFGGHWRRLQWMPVSTAVLNVV